ncbi:hypothetical protein CPB84DRAFT_1774185, partial [Gymnopilus junonius]
MSSLKLPFDIILAVIDQVAYYDDISTLRSCSLLHHDLLSHCRKHLFRTFDMRTASPDTDRYLSKFNALLTSSPHLTQYIRVVHILYINDSILEFKEWLFKRPFLVHFLRLLRNVEVFGLHFGFILNVSWDDIMIEPEVQCEIKRIITQPCCTQLALSGLVDIPRSLLNKCRFLKSLSMASCSLGSLPETEIRYPSLRANFSLFFDFSSLRHLTVTLSPDTQESMWKLIHSTSRTLETLTLNQTYKELINSAFRTFFPFNDGCLAKVSGTYQTLSPLSRLSRFSFSLIPHDLTGHSPLEHLAELCTLLRTSPEGVREICIKIDLFSSTTQDIQHLFFRNDDDNDNDNDDNLSHPAAATAPTITTTTPFLQELDTTLSSRSLFPRLTTVHLEILLAEEYIQTS